MNQGRIQILVINEFQEGALGIQVGHDDVGEILVATVKYHAFRTTATHQQLVHGRIGLDLATMLAMAGVDAPNGHQFDGVNLEPVLFTQESLGTRQLFWKGEAMRDGDWKLVNRKNKSQVS